MCSVEPLATRKRIVSTEPDVGSVIEGHLARIKALSPSGFAIAFHIRYTTPDFLFQTYSKDWLSIYSQEGLVMQDPIVGWSFANNGWIRWSDLENDDPAGVLERSAAFGMRYGIAMGVEEDGSRSVAGFARPDREYEEQEVDILLEEVRSLHLATLEAGRLSAAARDELKRMSVKFTHPDTPDT